MPKVNLTLPTHIDWLKAAMLHQMAEKGITQKRLSELTGYSPQWVCKLFKKSPWSWETETRAKVCKVLEIDKKTLQKCYADCEAPI